MAPPPAQQLSLFEDAGWPPLERFPTNTRFAQVRTPVLTDLQTSRQPLIVTGYTSLNVILDFLVTGMAGGSPVETLRLVLGHEPTLAVRPTYRLRDQPFDQIVVDYWLERGISLYQSAKLLVALELLRSGRITVRLSADPDRPIHAGKFTEEITRSRSDPAISATRGWLIRSRPMCGLRTHPPALSENAFEKDANWRNASGNSAKIIQLDLPTSCSAYYTLLPGPRLWRVPVPRCWRAPGPLAT